MFFEYIVYVCVIFIYTEYLYMLSFSYAGNILYICKYELCVTPYIYNMFLYCLE